MGAESSSGKTDLAVVPRVDADLDPAVGLVGDPTTGNRGAVPKAVLAPGRVRRTDAKATREANLGAGREANPERADRLRGRKQQDPTADLAANREANRRPKNDPNHDPPRQPRGMANEQTHTRETFFQSVTRSFKRLLEKKRNRA